MSAPGRHVDAPSGRDRSAGEDVEALLRRAELVVAQRLDGLLHGDYQGLVPGHGSELGEARAYVVGDDVRRIDWTVTARTREPHVRDTVADHELEATLVIDRSASLSVGTRRRTTGVLGLEIAAAIGLLVARGGNRVGVLSLRGGREPEWIPHGVGRSHVHGALRRVAAVEPSGTGDLAGGLDRAHRVARRRGFVVVVTDLHGARDYERPLRRLVARHDVVVVEVTDRLDSELPDVGRLTVVDAETGRRRMVDTGSSDLRERYARAAAERARQRDLAVRRTGADLLRVRTDDDWPAVLLGHLDRRRRRLARRPARGAGSWS